ncbi:DEAD/DEAH box helicase family protein [Histomonas meleagridis]|uniref:DEAD/DEAH box helicase family protein n=1 Tax=Histomonas meleagridis TaxID=135588 RepID=UPI003559409A|nr:DEAD/DEAH box helicase family protein [Histomonas meleagridis]KAH0802986.1 DEAD/DEAH box helicase family protein [Histomonas meleagridis]
MSNPSANEDEFLDEMEIMVTENPKPKKPVKKKKRNFRKSFKKKIDPSTYLADEEMTSLNIPPFLQHSYLSGIADTKITKFREWQKSLFEREEWKEGKNTIILVPTSGGKTVAADVAIAQTLFQDRTAKAILAVPFVALAEEKFKEYVSRFFPYFVRAFYMNVGGSDFHRGRIAICTYEKAHSILTSAINGGYSNRIKLVVIDEVHMLGDEFRGAVIEALIVKLLLMKTKPRIIGMTATINQSDAFRLAEWIHGFAFTYESRPAPIRQFVIHPNGNLSKIESNVFKPFIKLREVPGDINYIIDPIRTLLSRNPSSTIIIFVNTRNETTKVAKFIASKLYDTTLNLPKLSPPTEEITHKRSELLQNLSKAIGVIDPLITTIIMKGIGIHHAGLLLEERRLIETGARNKTLSILVATTTLSAGINIHSVSRVIILNIYRWTPKGNILIPTTIFTQMIGRAGRNDKLGGDAYICLHSTSKKEEEDLLKLTRNNIEDIQSYLLQEGNLERYFLQCLSSKLINPQKGLLTFINHSLSKNSLIENNSIKNLIHKELINENTMDVTKLGLSIAGSGLSIEEGISLLKVITKIQKNLCLEDDLHLLYLCISPNLIDLIKRESYDSNTWISIIENHKEVIHLITNKTYEQINHIQDLPKIYGGLGRINNELDYELDCIYIASIMLDLINEMNIKEITKKYGIDRGVIQSLQMQCATYAGQVTKFCELYGCVLLATTLNRFRQRLNFAARSELISLMILPSCNKVIARILYDSGIKSPIELSDLNVDAIKVIINENGNELNSEEIAEVANSIHEEAMEYTKSLSRLEQLEENAMYKSVENNS